MAELHVPAGLLHALLSKVSGGSCTALKALSDDGVKTCRTEYTFELCGPLMPEVMWMPSVLSVRAPMTSASS